MADENFSHRILRGVRRTADKADLVTVQSVGLAGRNDAAVLAWAAAHGRILLTHDVQTIPKFAAERIQAGSPMPGVVIVPKQMGIGTAIADLSFMISCAEPADVENMILYLPLKASASDIIHSGDFDR